MSRLPRSLFTGTVPVLSGPPQSSQHKMLALAFAILSNLAAAPSTNAVDTFVGAKVSAGNLPPALPPAPPVAPPPPPADKSSAWGYVEVLIASVFFGSNFVPVKRYETYDGMYYQWVMCSAIWMTGLLIQLLVYAVPSIVGDVDVHGAHGDLQPDEMIATGRPDEYSVKFVPVACLGGALWATGNTLSVPVINMIGLSLGLLIWGSANMLMGWASGMFGLVTNGHGDLEHLKSPPLNYAGVALTVIALGMYTQIKPAEQTRAVNSDVGGMNDVLLSNDAATTKQQGVKRMLGIFGAVVAGILFGNTFSPPSWVKANHHGPTNDLDYIFSHFTGIFATSTLWFIVYCVIMRGSPMINNRLTLPAMLSGVMWAIAQTMWFLANTAMSQSVAFPMICSGPGIVSALWGVFAFGEISGTRNYVVLCLAILTALTGCIMIGLSKGS